MNVSALHHRAPVADLPPERLAGNACLTEPEKIAAACRHFEALLLRQILQQTQKTVIPSAFTDTSTAASIYRDMVTERLADSISKSGALGLARTLEAQMKRPDDRAKQPATADGSSAPGTAGPSDSITLRST